LTSNDLSRPQMTFDTQNQNESLEDFFSAIQNISFGGGQNYQFLTFNDLSRPQMTFDTQNQNESLEDFFLAFQKYITWWG
jgi:hypothetical protein